MNNRRRRVVKAQREIKRLLVNLRTPHVRAASEIYWRLVLLHEHHGWPFSVLRRGDLGGTA